MNFSSGRARWNRFFFAPQSTLQISLFRIFYASCVILTLLLLQEDWLQWFGNSAWVSDLSMKALEPGSRINLFSILPASDAWVWGFFYLSLGSAILLLIGLWTRASAVLTFLCLTSLHQQNLLITHGGDTFLRVTGFFLIFAPSGAQFSIDAIRKRRLHPALGAETMASPWAQRLIQGELSILYIVSFLWKIKGHAWLDGSALSYVFHLEDLQRFTVPDWLLRPLPLQIGTWSTLLLELALGVGLWWQRSRTVLLILGVGFHLSLEYALNIPMFQWDVLSAYILFIPDISVDEVGVRIRNIVSRVNRFLPLSRKETAQ